MDRSRHVDSRESTSQSIIIFKLIIKLFLVFQVIIFLFLKYFLQMGFLIIQQLAIGHKFVFLFSCLINLLQDLSFYLIPFLLVDHIRITHFLFEGLIQPLELLLGRLIL